jgi:hypothetical protein
MAKKLLPHQKKFLEDMFNAVGASGVQTLAIVPQSVADLKIANELAREGMLKIDPEANEQAVFSQTEDAVALPPMMKMPYVMTRRGRRVAMKMRKV